MARRGLLTGIRAVYFDAVGTLIHPEPPAAEIYAAVGRRHGSRLAVEEIRRRFRAAWNEEEKQDEAAGWTTSAARETQRWQRIVAAVLTDVRDLPACFAELYDYFGKASAWRCDPQAADVLTELVRRGYGVGLASNNDARLRNVVAGLNALSRLQHLVISAEIGWRKPASAFFAEVGRRAGWAPAQLLHVGDDPINDLQGATQAGLNAVLFGTKLSRETERMGFVMQLSELLEISTS
jgi:putative hydrolase of the HAD superfamily